MKTKHLATLIPIALIFPMLQASQAGLIVTDPTLIATNQAHQAKDLAEQLIRKGNQETQILRLAEQVAQMENYLERYGHPGVSVANPELRKLIDLLRASGPSKSSNDINRDLDGAEIFRSTDNPIYEPTSPDILLDDDKAKKRNPELYREDAAVKRSLAHYRSVRSEVLERRQQLRQSIASTTTQLQAAQTESEVRKLTGVLIGLQTELKATDQEIGFASAELAARHFEIEAERRLRSKARLEEDRARHREASRKDAEFYQLMTAPTLFRARK